MYITDTHTVTLDEAAYEVTKALLPFLIEAGTPVAIRRDGWLLMVSTSIAGPLHEATKEYHEEAWAMETLEFTGGGTVWKRAIVSEDDVYLVTVKRRSTRK